MLIGKDYAATQATYFALFLAHQLVFIAFRIAFFLFISIFCCGCPCGESDIPELSDPTGQLTDPLANRIVSYQFESYVVNDIQLEDAGALAGQRENERRLGQLRQE
jgi:hypothetical protein